MGLDLFKNKNMITSYSGFWLKVHKLRLKGLKMFLIHIMILYWWVNQYFVTIWLKFWTSLSY